MARRTVGACRPAFAAVAVLVSVVPAAADRFEPVRDEIRRALRREDQASLAVAVFQGGRVLWEEGFGWADRKRGIPATAETPYSIASVTKPMTATALMVMRERRLLDLDAPADAYLGDSPLRARVGDVRRATLRRVASHTAGLTVHQHFFPEDRPRRAPPMDETIRRYGQLLSPPGERYRYSNLGYGILGHVVSRVAGRPFADVLRDEVFVPLGMRRSSLGPHPEWAPAVRYGPSGEPLPEYDTDHPGGSAAFASAHDLARFGALHARALLPDQRPILSRRSIGEMQRPAAKRPEGGGYGIGWEIHDDASGHRRVFHDGGMAGVSASLVLVPERRLVVVALSNARTQLPLQVAESLLSRLLPRDGPSARRAGAPTGGGERTRRGRRFRPPGWLSGAWTGAVDTPEGPRSLELVFEPRGASCGRVGDAPPRPLSGVRLEGRLLHARLLGDLDTADAPDVQLLTLWLDRRGDVLSGAAVAYSSDGRDFINGLGHWAELRRDRRRLARCDAPSP